MTAGEFDLIARLVERIGPAGGRVVLGPGDDAAVTVPGGATAVSVDALVEDVHFRRATHSLPTIGRKALARALSDLAAMGAAPGEALVALGVPADLDAAACEAIYGGLAALAEETGTALIGGDVTRAPVLILTVTVIGHAPNAEALVRRSGANPGDAIAVTGELGGAAAGLALLERPALEQALDPDDAEALVARQRNPHPRLAEGQALAAAEASAMIDVSDGIAADAGQIAQAGSVCLRVETERLPIQAGVEAVARAAGADPLDLAAGGDDYELLVCLPPERVEAATAALAKLGTALTVIGGVEPGSGVSWACSGEPQCPPSGFDHLG